VPPETGCSSSLIRHLISRCTAPRGVLARQAQSCGSRSYRAALVVSSVSRPLGYLHHGSHQPAVGQIPDPVSAERWHGGCLPGRPHYRDRIADGLSAGTLLPLISGMKVCLYPSPVHYRIVPEMLRDTNATSLSGTNTFPSGHARYAHPYHFYGRRYVFAGGEKLEEETR